jgi:hypothetical protein
MYKLGPASRVKVTLVIPVQPLTALLPNNTAVNAAMLVPILSAISAICSLLQMLYTTRSQQQTRDWSGMKGARVIGLLADSRNHGGRLFKLYPNCIPRVTFGGSAITYPYNATRKKRFDNFN